MKPETAQAALEFIKRVQLNVQEIPAMQQVLTELSQLASPELHTVDDDQEE